MDKIRIGQTATVILVDDEDYEWLNKHHWHLYGGLYAARSIHVPGSTPITLPMHREIWEHYHGSISGKLDIDHVNGRGLDNRKLNLRKATRSQNMANSFPQLRKTSKYKGVHLHNQNRNWIARITVNYKEYHLGSFAQEKDAALAYNHAATKHFGEFARLNVILEEELI